PKIRRSLLPRLPAAHGTSVRPLADPAAGGGNDVPRIPTADSHPLRSATHCDPRGILRRNHLLPERHEPAFGLAIDRGRPRRDRSRFVDAFLPRVGPITMRTRIQEIARARRNAGSLR